MLYLRADFANSLSTDYSIFVTFNYNPNYVNLIKSMNNRAWNNANKEWEVGWDCYSQLIGTLNNNNIAYNGQEFMASIENLKQQVEKLKAVQKQEANVDASILDSVEFKTMPFNYQKEGIAYGLTHDKFLLADQPGLGKALALDTPILTSTGWKLLKDIQIGEELFDEKGQICHVTNIFDHKQKNMYKVTFGDKKSVICCDEHLWTVYTRNSLKSKNVYRTLQLKDLMKDYQLAWNSKYYIPMTEPIKFPKKNLPIHPYILGALIGDGCFIHCIAFTNKDNFIIDKISSLLDEEYCLKQCPNKPINYLLVRKKTSKRNINKNKYKTILKELGLFNKNSHYKFIPEIYKYSCPEDRLQLLQGLMDTDGYISKVGTMQFCSVSEKLCDDIGQIIESLGGTFTKRKKILKNKFEAWDITFKLKSGMYPVSLPRKVNRIVKSRKYEPIRNIKKIEFIGKQPARCLTVDSPSNLFLINNCIVTHNTLMSSNIARLKRGGQHCLVICGYKSLLFNWVKEIQTHTTESGYVIGQRQNKRNLRFRTGKVLERLEDLQNIDKIEDFFLITDITTLRQSHKTEYKDKNGKTRYNKEFYMADAIEDLCRKGVIGRIILDESHVFKNIDVDQTQALLKLKSCPYKIAMTGTPIMNKNIDLYPIMVWLGQETRNYWQFRDRYCKLGGFKGKQIVGDKNNPELHERLSKFMLRRLKQDVLDLPEKIMIDELLEMDGKQWALYEKTSKLAKAEMAKMKGNKNALLASMANLRKITCHPAWVDPNCTDSVKYERARQIVFEAAENNEKTIIFSCFTTPFEAELECLNLKRELEMYNPAMIIGDTKDRMEQVDKFQNDPTCKVIIGSIGAMGVGLTLNAASNVIFLDEPWNQAIKDQAIDRSHRVGTKNNVKVYTLMCKDTVDEGVHKTVTKKGRLALEIVDGVTAEELENIILGNT